MARCRRIQRAHAAARRAACQEAAWLLRERAEGDVFTRSALATLLFASGDPARSFAVGRREHLPSVAVLTDLIEMNLQITATDELLRAVWIKFILPENRDLPERVALPLRMRRRDVNSGFKGMLDGFKAVAGVDLGEAYAKMLFGFVTGLWTNADYEGDSWATIVESMKLPLAWQDDPGSYIRILDLYNLAAKPASQLPATDYIFAFSAWRRGIDTDIRSEESAVTSIDLLETHRAAGMEYWLTVVPPFTPTARSRKERATVREDCDLVDEYQSWIAATGLGHGAIHHQIYGDQTRRRTLKVSQNDQVMNLNDWGERRAAWHEKGMRQFPAYVVPRMQEAWTVSKVQGYLQSGIPL
jgi:hypothetical protein